MGKIDRFFALWAIVLPITSVLLLPSVQGTTPGYMFAFLSLPVAVLFIPRQAGSLLKILLLLVSIHLCIAALSQLGLLFTSGVSLDNLRLVDPASEGLILRSTLFTQSLYLLAGFLTFGFVAVFYRTSWDRYIFGGAALLAVYGIYEIFFVFVTGRPGDFLSNRVFVRDGIEGSGSLQQFIDFAGIQLMRLKSLTGEPSMYAFTILPFWIYAIHRQKHFLHLLLLFSLVLTTSTTAIFGIVVYIGLRVWYLRVPQRFLGGRLDSYLSLLVAGSLVVFTFLYDFAVDFIEEMVVAKILQQNFSGADRFDSFESSIEFFVGAPLFNQLFGIGFGYIRSTDLLSTLLVNVGVIGLILYLALFFWPIYKLRNTYEEIGLKAALLVILCTSLVAVSEFAYLTIWLFLGIAYNKVWQR